MAGSHEYFGTTTEWDSKLHTKFGDKNKKAFKGEGVVPFRMESGGRL